MSEYTYNSQNLLPVSGRIAVNDETNRIMRQARRRERLQTITKPSILDIDLLRRIADREHIDIDADHIHEGVTSLVESGYARYDRASRRHVATALGRAKLGEARK